MVIITGDIHGEVFRFTNEYIPNESKLNKNDLVIVCGDFGIPWYNETDTTGWSSDQKKLNKLEEKTYTIAFVDGNHENFNELYKYDEIKFCGGKAHRLRKNIYHLTRGEIYTFEGSTFFCMGGAASIDKCYRQENISWWNEEIPNNEEYKNAIKNLENHNKNVDYIITHTCPSEIVKNQMMCDPRSSKDYELTGFFDWVLYETNFIKWFFGHWHIDKEIEYKDKLLRALYTDAVILKND